MTTRALKRKDASSQGQIPVFRTEDNRAQLMAIYADKLRQWPVPYETFFVPTRYGTTHVIAMGDRAARPVVLLHPDACSSIVWSSLTPALSQRYRLYAPDTIGDMGRSQLDDLDRYPKTGPDFSAWLDDLYGQLDLTTADLIGGSMGGWIAQHRAIEAPDRVRRLVLLGPMGLPSWRSTLRLLGPMMSLVLRPTDAKRDKMMKRGFGEGERVTREMAPWLRIAGKCRGRVGWPWKIPDARLRMITAPTLLFLGGKDDAVGSATAAARRARRTITGCEIEILPNAGHLMMVDEPEFIGDRIAGFLEGATRGGH